MSHTENIARLANELPPITLDEMKSIRLMNRMDTKFVTTVDMLVRLLDLCKGSYYSQSINGKRVSPYRTTYWDYPERHDMFHFHQAGHLPRTKVRARTYLDSGHSFLEIKRKNNHGKTKKKRVAVPSLGSFEPKKRMERITMHPSTGRRILIPPKLSVTFRPSTMLKLKVRQS